MERQVTERDLILAPNEFAFISDETKGHISAYVGSIKQSLANTDRPVIFDDDTKRFVRVALEQATQTFRTAPEGWYIILKNPAENDALPKTSFSNSLVELQIGKKVNIPGPASFPLWPGQMTKVVQGHHLKSNQYVLVRVYDEVAAQANWQKAVIKKTGSEEETTSVADILLTEETGEPIVQPGLTMGKMIVIKGTDVSFFIPPTGMEVVKDDANNYVRNAVTLERLEHCIKLDENGTKTFTEGPAVVFPKPTEDFIKKDGTRKFRAIELNEKAGLYIKVIAPYKDEEGKEHKVGDELFITGADQPIYFPREEHAIVKYGDEQVHYATAIPPGEGRYVLNRLTGEIELISGPEMLLPDPRTAVLIRRVLDPKLVNLWFPGNPEAVEYNKNLQDVITSYGEGEDYVSDRVLRRSRSAGLSNSLGSSSPKISRLDASNTTYSWEGTSDQFAGDELQRKGQYTRPRQITIDTKYEGVVSISVWTGYAVQVVSKTGNRKVIVGPATYLLQYDEVLETMELSTGTPKRTDSKISTVYLRVLHNKVSDRIEAETSDLCKVYISLSYCIDFLGDHNKWFDVEDYVGYVTERLRSIIRAEVKNHGVEDFYAKADRIIRDLILGFAPERAEGEDKTERPGRPFEENGMKIVDVDISKITIGDENIAEMLVHAQNETVRDTLYLKTKQRKLEVVKETERIEQETIIAKQETSLRTAQAELDRSLLAINNKAELDVTNLKSKINLELADIKHATDKAMKQYRMDRDSLEAQKSNLPIEDELNDANLAIKQKEIDQDLAERERILDLELKSIKSKMDAFVGRVNAISPQLVAALTVLGDKTVASSMAEHLGPVAMLKKIGVGEAFRELAKGTPLEFLGFGSEDGNSGLVTGGRPAHLEEPH